MSQVIHLGKYIGDCIRDIEATQFSDQFPGNLVGGRVIGCESYQYLNPNQTSDHVPEVSREIPMKDTAISEGPTKFNEESMDWYVPGVAIARDQLAVCGINDGDIESYQQDGVVLLKSVFSDWVEPLRRGFKRNIDHPGEFAFPCDSNPTGKPGMFFDSYCNWQRIPEYREFLEQSCAAFVAAKFMRSRTARFFHEHAFIKTAGTQHATPWHQDLPYYCVDGRQTVSIYVSLDFAPEDVAVRFIPGSHRWNRLFDPRDFLEGEAFPEDFPGRGEQTESVPDADIQQGRIKSKGWTLEPGDAILFDFRTLHGTSAAEVRSDRRAFSTRWLGDDVVFRERPVKTSPPYSNHGMQDGGALREDWFPLVWDERSDHKANQ